MIEGLPGHDVSMRDRRKQFQIGFEAKITVREIPASFV